MLKIMIGVEENILYFRLLSHSKYYAYGGGEINKNFSWQTPT